MGADERWVLRQTFVTVWLPDRPALSTNSIFEE